MSKLSVIFVLALAACFIPEAMSACSSRQLDNLESQIEICCNGLPLQMYGGYWQWSRAVTARMRRESTCNLDNAPAYLLALLNGQGYIGSGDINRAVTCVKNSISYGICC